jgi:uncharacterized peroxidase-related enzyme
MARLSYVEKAGATPDQEKVLAQVTQKSGKVANVWKLWMHSPQTLEAFLPFNKSLIKGTLDPRLRELAYIKASLTNNCAYCANAHKAIGLRAGISEAQLHEIDRYTESASFSPLEKRVLRYAEELTRTITTSDELLRELKADLSEGQIVELCVTVGLANLTNRFNMSLMTDPDE